MLRVIATPICTTNYGTQQGRTQQRKQEVRPETSLPILILCQF
jgi:hypothetical protein